MDSRFVELSDQQWAEVNRLIGVSAAHHFEDDEGPINDVTLTFSWTPIGRMVELSVSGGPAHIIEGIFDDSSGSSSCRSAAIFTQLEERVKADFPEAAGEAQDVADKVVDVERADADQIWSVLWDKPLFANARVDIAKNWCERLRPFMADAWRHWGQDDDFVIVKRGNGIGRDGFSVGGVRSKKIVDESGVALHRLYAIQGAAQSLRERAAVSSTPFSDMKELSLAAAVGQLRREFGRGWGPVTTLHFLTDLGLAVKPDIHLVRTMRALGDRVAARIGNVPNFEQAVLLNDAVRTLLRELDRAETPANLRYLDKMLMEISRTGVLRGAGMRHLLP